jgi:hypothetical protein
VREREREREGERERERERERVLASQRRLKERERERERVSERGREGGREGGRERERERGSCTTGTAASGTLTVSTPPSLLFHSTVTVTAVHSAVTAVHSLLSTPLSLLFHSVVTAVPLRRHCCPTPSSLLSHSVVTAVPLRRHCCPTPPSLLSHSSVTAVPLRRYCCLIHCYFTASLAFNVADAAPRDRGHGPAASRPGRFLIGPGPPVAVRSLYHLPGGRRSPAAASVYKPGNGRDSGVTSSPGRRRLLASSPSHKPARYHPSRRHDNAP